MAPLILGSLCQHWLVRLVLNVMGQALAQVLAQALVQVMAQVH